MAIVYIVCCSLSVLISIYFLIICYLKAPRLAELKKSLEKLFALKSVDFSRVDVPKYGKLKQVQNNTYAACSTKNWLMALVELVWTFSLVKCTRNNTKCTFFVQ